MSTVTLNSTTPPEAAAASQQIFQLATGYIFSTALQNAVALRMADHLAREPKSTAELAQATGANEDALYRVLRLLASAGVFEEIAPRRFATNLPGSLLESGKPIYHVALWMADPFHLRVYAHAKHSVLTAQPAVEQMTGMPVFEYFARDKALSEVFNDAMTAFSNVVIPAVLDAYDFSGIETLVDVAGGHGQVLTSILQRHPLMRGVLMDVEHVIAGAVPRIREAGVADRCAAVSGDFFQAVPGGDGYVMKHIIHDWEDEKALLILRNIRKAIAPAGRVVLLESVIEPGNAPDLGKAIDVEMLMMTGGCERTADEFGTLFQQAGFELTRIVPTASPLSVIEARAA